MTEIGFYHLQKSSLPEALPRLLERVLAAGQRANLRAPGEAEVEELTRLLWTYSEPSFLPHGSARDGFPGDQPIYLTAAEENPNAAEVLVLTGGMEPDDLGTFKRCLNVFDGRDGDAVAAARASWKRWLAAGHSLTYWQQKPEGGWEKKA